MTRLPSSRFLAAFLLLACAAGMQTGRAQPVQDASFTGIEAMVPTRDGTRLYTQIYAPKQYEGHRVKTILVVGLTCLPARASLRVCGGNTSAPSTDGQP